MLLQKLVQAIIQCHRQASTCFEDTQRSAFLIHHSHMQAGTILVRFVIRSTPRIKAVHAHGPTVQVCTLFYMHFCLSGISRYHEQTLFNRVTTLS